MKNLIYILIIFVAGCSEPLTTVPEVEVARQPGASCFANRATVKQLTGEKGVVYAIGNDFVIRNDNWQLFACNLPTAFMVDSLEVEFGADVKEIRNHEHWIGTPCELTYINL